MLCKFTWIKEYKCIVIDIPILSCVQASYIYQQLHGSASVHPTAVRGRGTPCPAPDGSQYPLDWPSTRRLSEKQWRVFQMPSKIRIWSTYLPGRAPAGAAPGRQPISSRRRRSWAGHSMARPWRWLRVLRCPRKKPVWAWFGVDSQSTRTSNLLGVAASNLYGRTASPPAHQLSLAALFSARCYGFCVRFW